LPERDDLTGSTVGRFTIDRRLGAGGMGEVYRAEDTQLKRTVAIKRLAPQAQGDRANRNELLKEAQRASALNHPRIAGVYDVFAEGNELFLVMEYIDGVTLRERMESPISASEFCNIAIQCAEALGAAHEKGILHGDLKPTNIMLTRDKGDVKVCDFGLAPRVPHRDQSLAETISTLRSGIMGTPAYMAPEIILEQPVDLRADVFSLGVVFYEMLAHRNPFSSDTLIQTIDRIRTLSPETLDSVNPEVSPKLARVVDRMIQKDPGNRYSAIGEVHDDLVAAQAETAVSKRRSWFYEHRRARIALAALLLVATIAVQQLEKWRLNTPSEQQLPAEINLAILPFAVTGADPNKQFFSQGLVEALNMQLSRLTVSRKFQVAATTDVRARNVRNAQDARAQLGANVALSGALQYSGQRIQITSVLLDTRSGRLIRRETVTADPSNVLNAEQRVADAVVRMLAFTLRPDERAALNGNETAQPGAYDFYLQGRGYLLNFDRIENLDNAITVFRKALESDPRYALAYAGLGEAYWRKQELTTSAVWVEPARAACEGAMGIDPSVAEPHACLGMVLNGTGEYEKAAAEFNLALNREPTNDLFYSGLATAYEKLRRPVDAEQTYRRAIELRPHYWAGYDRLGSYYYRLGRYDQAIAAFQQVVALTPDSVRGYSSLGAAYFRKDRTTEAIAAFQKSLSIKPNYIAAFNLGTLYYVGGDYRRAVEAFRKALSLEQGNYQIWGYLGGSLESIGESDQAKAAYKRARELAEERLRVNSKDAAVHMSMADYNAALDEMDKARLSLTQVLRLAPTDSHTLYRIAVFYEFRLHQRDDALLWLSRAIEHGQTWQEVDGEQTLRELRKDPRFQRMRHGQ
jgi:serine/threonine-protein kinase